MLRINLLPPYIYEGAKRRNVMILWFVCLAAVIGGFLFWKVTIDKETQRIKDAEAALVHDRDLATQNAALASRINAESAVVRGKSDFVGNAVKYDQKTYQELFTNVAMYTWPRVLYDNISPSGSTVAMGAYAPSLADVGHYMMYMERNPAISRVDIAMSSIPAFPNSGGAAAGSGTGVRPFSGGGHDFQVSLTLVKPIDGAPSYPGGGAAAGGAAGQGADPGAFGGSAGAMGGGGGSGGAPGGSGGGMMGSGSMGGK